MFKNSLIPALAAVLAGPLIASPAAAQDRSALASDGPSMELSIGAGVANLFVIEGPSFDEALSIGLGAGVRVVKRVWIDVDLNRYRGLVAAPAPCGLVNVECVGNGREGFEDATTGAIALTYHFGGDNTHLYVTGGYGFIRAEGFQTTTFGGTGRQLERPMTLTGWGPSAGIGLRIPLSSRLALKPDVRIYGADGPNLTSVRGSVALAGAW